MQSVIQMTDYFKENSPKTTRPLVALYCGSRAGNKPVYLEKAIHLSQGLAEHGFGLVYGGASIGLMGQVADAMIQHGGEAVGVIPEFMLDYEIAHNQLTELHVVTSMHQRKAMM
ncbi:LOG family protein, partial [Klebsiella pneumoniae]|nr:LOG family protein [Klebsiella pneumoniae]